MINEQVLASILVVVLYFKCCCNVQTLGTADANANRYERQKAKGWSWGLPGKQRHAVTPRRGSGVSLNVQYRRRNWRFIVPKGPARQFRKVTKTKTEIINSFLRSSVRPVMVEWLCFSRSIQPVGRHTVPSILRRPYLTLQEMSLRTRCRICPDLTPPPIIYCW